MGLIIDLVVRVINDFAMLVMCQIVFRFLTIELFKSFPLYQSVFLALEYYKKSFSKQDFKQDL